MPLALLTGATRGIGRACAENLITTHDLLIGGRDAAAARAVCEELTARDTGHTATPFVADLTDAAAVEAAVADLGETLDVVVHSAGVVAKGAVIDTPRAEWQRVLEINVTAVADLTRLLLPRLRAARGLVVTINSGAGHHAAPTLAVYAASKFALRALTDALRAEEAGRVRVTSVHPGRVDTDMQRELQAAGGREDYVPGEHLRPEAIAAAVRLAVDAGADTSIDEVSVRPTSG